MTIKILAVDKIIIKILRTIIVTIIIAIPIEGIFLMTEIQIEIRILETINFMLGVVIYATAKDIMHRNA